MEAERSQSLCLEHSCKIADANVQQLQVFIFCLLRIFMVAEVVGRFGIAISSSLSFVSVQASVATPSVGGPHIPESLSSSADAQIASATALLTATVMMESGEICYNLHRFKGRSSTHEAQPVIEPEELMTKDIARTDSWDRAERVRDIPDPRLPDSPIVLRRLFPGVHGRMTELCRPNQKKYNLAVTIAMGRFIDNDHTEKQCIEYLKDQRIPLMTFIPLHTVKSKSDH
ncbi:structural maintenance of chromosomes protein 1 [Artemisia annua]|uniref:Structural maintenance of chromosomes protein 1 n=1 Tax=Artemisia annua TaxID=35608 RepID=A0A2U1Q9F6_ARTAN|nr:structural maintenance of chromosomes protein 1 [Artemisia annua]